MAGFVDCEGSGPAGPGEPPSTVAKVTTSLDFGDPPLSGLLRIAPAEGGAGLRYSADLDGDNNPDEMGPVGLGVTLAYRFEESGVHGIVVSMERADERYRVERDVVANDTTAVEVLQSDYLIFSESLTGIAVNGAETDLFVAKSGFAGQGSEPEILHLNPFGFALRHRLVPPLTSTQESGFAAPSLALSPDDRVLYADTGDSLVAIGLDTGPRVLGVVGPADYGTYLAVREDGTVYSGGERGLVRIDPVTGRILARMDAQDGGAFVLSPDGRSIAFLKVHSCTVSLLDADRLVSGWTAGVAEPPSQCLAAAFSPEGDRLYVLRRGDAWRFLVLDAENGDVLRDMILAMDDRRGRSPAVSSPVATSASGRHVVFATEIGAFFVDTRTDLPLFHLDTDNGGTTTGCCNVTSTKAREVFFFVTGWNDLVTKVRILP